MTHPVRALNSGKRAKGFTLIELLVVIAIIAILTAILFPVFARARENARRASCQSNLKQIGLGLLQYVQDYDEKYPGEGYADPTAAADVSGWAYTIQPYVKSEQLFQCPSETSMPFNGAPTSLQIRAANAGFTDYYYNFQVGTANAASVAYPANTVLLGDGTGSLAGANYNRTKTDDVGSGSLRHLEGGDYAFVDGHVKWLKPQNVLPSDNAGAKTITLCNGGPHAPTGSNATFCLY